MKLLVITAAAVLAVTTASAQPDIHHNSRAYLRSASEHVCQGAPPQGGNRPGRPNAGAGGGRPGGGQANGKPGGGGGRPGGGPNNGGPSNGRPPAGGGPNAGPPGGGNAGPGNRPGGGGQAGNRPGGGPSNNRPGFAGRPGGTPGFSRPPGQPPRNFDRRAYQRNWNASRRYSAGVYRRPAGWYYRRWAFGQTLPALFWARDYWLTSWSSYGLMTPPFGYQWVRYGDDAILVDTTTGQILQAQYGVFY